jgi:hypothetical protein
MRVCANINSCMGRYIRSSDGKTLAAVKMLAWPHKHNAHQPPFLVAGSKLLPGAKDSKN